MPEFISSGNFGGSEIQQRLAFGIPDIEAFHGSVRENVAFTVAAQTCGEAAAYALAATSVLSDAQELVEAGHPDRAKHEINKAKFLLGQIIEQGTKRVPG